ncbi:Subtilisin-like serine protease [Marinobacter algicola DG893]|uniref:Subtilisin-like serine protease n=2 Tax=Marinobacter algicola TaxID=236100 RepID=A6F466_9GAMM|nr:Subtilisin-like serine protease [Marinobacter algicola DG893]
MKPSMALFTGGFLCLLQMGNGYRGEPVGALARLYYVLVTWTERLFMASGEKMTKSLMGMCGALLVTAVIVGCGGSSSSGADAGCLGENGGSAIGSVGAESVGVSGVIEIESQTHVDSDTADDLRLSQATSNNCDDEAQSLPVTGVSGGYLSPVSGGYPVRQGEDFQFTFEADNQDYYTADLQPGDRVSLQVFSDPRVAAPQPRMQIFNQNDRLVFDSADGSGSVPYLYVIESDAGDHVIRVSAASGGPFRYVVIAADGNASSMMNTAYGEADFVPGEAVMSFESGYPSGATSSAMASSLSVDSARELRPGVWHLRRSGVQAMAATDSGQARAETIRWVRDLQSQPDIASASPNYLYKALTTTPDSNPLYDRQWHYPLIGLPVAWQAAARAGEGVGVAVLDTGLFSSAPDTLDNWHPDLLANVLIFGNSVNMDFVTGEADLDNQQGRDQNPADPGDGQPRSSNFHGTHVAGIVAAVDNNQGVVGVANQANLVPVRVLGEAGTGSLGDLIAAIEWASTQPDIDVINLSLGGVGDSQALEDAINDAHNAGKLVVAAAGNQGTDELTFPAAFMNVVGVGAVDGGGVRASYSNIGPSVDLVAPGGDASRDANLDNSADVVVSAWGSDDNGAFEPGYAGLQGTSMAAPHVSGVYALMKAENQTLTSSDFKRFLIAGDLTEGVESSEQFEYGAGLINAVKSMDAALSGNIPVVMAGSPSVLTFDQSNTEAQLTLNTYPSTANITITSINTGVDWLETGPELKTGEAPPATVTVGINTALLDQNNSFATDLQIEYDGDGTHRTLTVPVNVRLIDPNDPRNAGRHYVLLISANGNGATAYQTVVSASGGQYNFSFANVEPGDYFLVAGTDVDNNGSICENGEACAEYPVNGLPQAISVTDTPLESLRFSTSFRRPTISQMGFPRVGFEGYRLKSDDGTEQGDIPNRRIESER